MLNVCTAQFNDPDRRRRTERSRAQTWRGRALRPTVPWPLVLANIAAQYTTITYGASPLLTGPALTTAFGATRYAETPAGSEMTHGSEPGVHECAGSETRVAESCNTRSAVLPVPPAYERGACILHAAATKTPGVPGPSSSLELHRAPNTERLAGNGRLHVRSGWHTTAVRKRRACTAFGRNSRSCQCAQRTSTFLEACPDVPSRQ